MYTKNRFIKNLNTTGKVNLMKTKLLSMLLIISMVLAVLVACNATGPADDTDGSQQVLDSTLNLVVDGVSEYVIVRGENAYISEVTASTELQSYIKQISGAKLPIVTDATVPVEKEIVVGKTNREAEGEFDRDELGDDGLVIKTNGQKLFLVGGEQRGTLYAVYEFLESYLGCGFYTADVEKVPEMKTIALERIEEDKQIPIMEYRSAYWWDYANQNISVKRKLNGWTENADISKEFGGKYIVNPFVHSFVYLVSFSEYSETHPEYFAHNDDGTIIENSSSPVQLCLTNETVLQMSIETVRNWINSTPNIKVVDISQNDGGGPCMCSDCQAVYAEENGAYSGAVIRFVNAIATALKDEFPDVKFQTLAYQYTRDVCVTKPAENVIIRLCPIETCKNHPYDECDVITYQPSNSVVSDNSFAEDLKNWAEISKAIYIWDYVTNYSDYCVNFSTFETLKKNIRFFADNKVKGVFAQGDGQGSSPNSSGEFGELRAYLYLQLLWDPYMSDEEYYGLIEDFMQNVYGPGWTYLKEFLDYRFDHEKDFHASCYEDHKGLQAEVYPNEIVHTRDTTEIPEGVTLEMIQNYETTDWTPYSTYYSHVEKAEIIDKGYDLFAKAMELAENDVQRAKIDKALIQVQRLDSYYRSKVRAQKFSNLVKVFKNALSGLEIAEDEQATLKIAAELYFSKITSAEYSEFNKELYNKMLSYGVNRMREGGYYLPDGEPNFTKVPLEW
ncbi:MAG: DUF4838 domain-containing protein [Ruminococcaceae bacterium]|nr:DUF4838 domain-containing protein [Oscillospiraceae bacterium]